MTSEVTEFATKTDTNNTQSPAKKMKVEQSSSAVHGELDSYLTCTDSGPDVLLAWKGGYGTPSKLNMCAKWVCRHQQQASLPEECFL